MIGMLLFLLWPSIDAVSQDVPRAITQPVVRAEYYGELGCAHCDTFTRKQLPAAELASGVTVDLELYDILSTEGFKRCEARLAELGESFRIFPVLILGENVYQGNSAIDDNLVNELKHYAEHGFFIKRQSLASTDGTSKVGSGNSMKWTVIPIFLAGLVDGINPCAFTTLLFFMSYLGLRGGSRKRIALAGLTFASGVFLAYFLLGLGLVNTLRMGNQLAGLRLGLKFVVTGLTSWFCILSIRDVYLLRKGQSSAMALKLPEALRTKIDGAIRKSMKSKAFYTGLFGTGVVVSILELACTGQVYFPAISFMVQSDASWLGIGSLILYNLAFITPLLTVLILVLLGLRQEVLRKFFMHHLGVTKLALAAVFAVLALSVWFV